MASIELVGKCRYSNQTCAENFIVSIGRLAWQEHASIGADLKKDRVFFAWPLQLVNSNIRLREWRRRLRADA